MNFSKRGFRAMVLGLVATAGLALAPAAFARDHFSLGISVPGVSVGIGSRHSFVGVGVGGYYPGYYGGYYGPAAYVAPAPVYYGPAYYGPAYYGGVGYYGRPVYRGGYYGGRGGYYHGGYAHGGGYRH